MSATLAVLMHGQVAGTASRRSGGALVFAYADGYRGTPLSVSMPTGVPRHPDKVIAPWLAGLLPDNDAVLARWGRRFRVSAAPFSLLGTPVGHDCAGAVQFARPADMDDLISRPGHVEWLTEDDVADRLRLLVRDRTAWLGHVPTGQFSLAGAQSKIALHLEDGRWGVPMGSVPTTHILKPALDGFDGHEVNEHICLRAARTLGLPAARTRVQHFGEIAALVVDRYDRISLDGTIVRVHQEDVCQALSVHPGAKYESEGGPGIADVIRLLRATMPHDVAPRATATVMDAVIFNWLIGGTDAHAKNYSLMLSGEAVRLAPLYDIASALPYPGMDERDLKFAMKLGRDYEVWPHHDPWPGVASRAGLDAEALRARVDEISAACPDALDAAAREVTAAGIDSAMATALPGVIAGRVDRCRAVMGLAPVT